MIRLLRNSEQSLGDEDSARTMLKSKKGARSQVGDESKGKLSDMLVARVRKIKIVTYYINCRPQVSLSLTHLQTIYCHLLYLL